MKKYILYFYVKEINDYQLKKINSLNDLFIEYNSFLEIDRYYFSRSDNNKIERVYGPFLKKEDPLINIVIDSKRNYLLEVEEL